MNIEDLKIGDIVVFGCGEYACPFGDEVYTSVGVVLRKPEDKITTDLGDLFYWEYILDVRVGYENNRGSYTGRTRMIDKVIGNFDLSEPQEILTIVDELYERNNFTLSTTDRKSV
jgi:hypothetical protein